ncbi:hypothetical protein AAKU67_001098 [Oxalobacteraceae bacterium GrIS 2.11]
MQTTYEADVIAWANEQAALLRSGKFSGLDIVQIAEEIEEVGKSEQRELASRMTILLAHLLKWQVQPSHRGSSWEATISAQRGSIARLVSKTPSLKNSLSDSDWWLDAWGDAVALAATETEPDLSTIPKQCPWSYSQLMANDFFPD